MNDRQNTVVATTVVGLVLVVIYLCPWRVESSGEIRWSPIYQPPMSVVRTYDRDLGTKGGSRVAEEDAHIAIDILLLEVVAVGAAGGLLFLLTSDSEGSNDGSSQTLTV